MASVKKFSLLFGFLSVLLATTNAWPRGSSIECPPAPEPKCPGYRASNFERIVPHPYSCHFYIHCNEDGAPICLQCPPDFSFNVTSKECDIPAIFGCGDTTTASTTTVATTIPTTTVTPPTPGQCLGPPENCPSCTCEGDRTPHPNECEWYFECNKEHKYVLQKCNNGFHYNSEYQVCDYPCNAGDNSNPQPPPGPGSCPSTGEKPVPTCPFPQPPYEVFFPHPQDCGWFYHCAHGVAYCKNCPAGLHWNTAKNVCDWPSQAQCSI